MKTDPNKLFRFDRGDEPPVYIEFIEFLNLKQDYVATFLPNDNSLVWFARDDGKHEFHPLLFTNAAPMTIIVPVLLPDYSNIRIFKMRIALTNALVQAFDTCYIRFEMVSTHAGDRAQMFLVNKITKKKRQVTRL